MSTYRAPWYGWILQRFLLATPAVTDLCGKQAGNPCIYLADVPAAAVEPFVRLSTFGGAEEYGWRAELLVQVDVFGGDRGTNHDLAEAARTAIKDQFSGVLTYTAGTRTETAVVNGIRIGGVSDDTDTSTTKPRPAARFDVVIFGHPKP